MPLLDHFHPPLHGPRKWEGFHHAWATVIAQQLNEDVLPSDFYAEPEISVGPELEVNVATIQLSPGGVSQPAAAVAVWDPPQPAISAKVDFARLETYGVRVYQDLGGAELRATIELVSPAHKDRPGSRRTFAAKCAGHLQHGVSVVIVDVVTSRKANLHEELFETLEAKTRSRAWQSPTDLYAAAYRPVMVRKAPRVEVWPASGQRPRASLLSLRLCQPFMLLERLLQRAAQLHRRVGRNRYTDHRLTVSIRHADPHGKSTAGELVSAIEGNLDELHAEDVAVCEPLVHNMNSGIIRFLHRTKGKW